MDQNKLEAQHLIALLFGIAIGISIGAALALFLLGFE
ncbi:hypothetical protein LCGC14_0464620 [marine sediment metagenome]|uniref:Uncharacterized protein n=1 Tax=marine sediment metagenome TaxID=412755 RepID=A0A0F9SE23_9ZZZZ